VGKIKILGSEIDKRLVKDCGYICASYNLPIIEEPPSTQTILPNLDVLNLCSERDNLIIDLSSDYDNPARRDWLLTEYLKPVLSTEGRVSAIAIQRASENIATTITRFKNEQGVQKALAENIKDLSPVPWSLHEFEKRLKDLISEIKRFDDAHRKTPSGPSLLSPPPDPDSLEAKIRAFVQLNKDRGGIPTTATISKAILQDPKKYSIDVHSGPRGPTLNPTEMMKRVTTKALEIYKEFIKAQREVLKWKEMLEKRKTPIQNEGRQAARPFYGSSA
jgi:hypothetical protein